MSEFRIERLSEQNLSDLILLYKQAFGQDVEIDFLRKKFNTSVFGTKYLGFIAYSNTNTAAAYYGVFPVKVKYKGEDFLAAQSGDTMTHPNYRGKGLFIELAKTTYALAKEEGLCFVFGFPNNNSFPGFVNKLNWKHYANVNNYLIKTKTLPFDKLAKKWDPFSSVYNRYVNGILKSYLCAESFENSLFQQNHELGGVVHDHDFKAYKSYSSASIITLRGKKCWIKVDGRLWVGDIEYCEEQEFDQIIASLTILAKKLFCSGIQFSVFENSAYDGFLKKYTTPFYKNPVGFLQLNQGPDGGVFAYQGLDFDTY